MTGPGEKQFVVRIRIPGANAWPSRPMTHGEAIAQAAALRDLVRDEGDGAGFIEFESYGGRTVHVRAREVLSVEVDQWKDRTHEPATGGAFTGVVTIEDGPETGTDFLRRQRSRA